MTKNPYNISSEFERLEKAINEGRGKINSKILQKAYENKLISDSELSVLSLNLLKKIEADLNLDHLTGLYNRIYLDTELKNFIEEFQYLQTDRREQEIKSLLIISLDMNFLKLLNDTYGHKYGDQGLITLARRLKGAMKKHDIVARYGGDEFVCLLLINKKEEGDNQDIHKRIFERIQEAVNKDLAIDFRDSLGKKVHFPFKVAMGYTILRKGEIVKSATELIHQADQMMYINKKKLKTVDK